MTPEERRRAENKSLLDRLRRGESLARVDVEATHWPPRPLIKKDPQAIARIYGRGDGHEGR